MRIFIDGYNVIHALASLCAIADTNIDSARDALIEMAARLLKPGVRICVVFDGQGLTTDTTAALPGVDGLDAVYTARNLSADSWIERTVYKSRDRQQCTIVTADGGIRDLCRGLGARVFSPEWLENETQRSAGPRHPSGAGTSSGGLNDRLDDSSRERLTRLGKKLGEGESK